MGESAFKNITPYSCEHNDRTNCWLSGFRKRKHMKSGRKGGSAEWRGVQGEGIEEDLIKTQYMHACMKFSNQKKPQFNFY